MYTRAEVTKKITSTLSALFEVDPEATMGQSSGGSTVDTGNLH